MRMLKAATGDVFAIKEDGFEFLRTFTDRFSVLQYLDRTAKNLGLLCEGRFYSSCNR